MATTTNGQQTTAAATEAAAPQSIIIERLERLTAPIAIVGVTPLISHNWSEKAKRMMLEKQQSSAQRKKDRRDPQADYEASFYRLPDGNAGMPATAFKSAIAEAARFYSGITIVALKTALFVKGEGPEQLVRIDGDVGMFEATVRNQTGVADLRYRPMFWPWSATLLIEYLPSMLDETSLVNLVDASGRNGVGDWRPSSPKSRTGTYGTYEVKI